jgi:hypothetical protein
MNKDQRIGTPLVLSGNFKEFMRAQKRMLFIIVATVAVLLLLITLMMPKGFSLNWDTIQPGEDVRKIAGSMLYGKSLKTVVQIMGMLTIAGLGSTAVLVLSHWLVSVQIAYVASHTKLAGQSFVFCGKGKDLFLLTLITWVISGVIQGPIVLMVHMNEGVVLNFYVGVPAILLILFAVVVFPIAWYLNKLLHWLTVDMVLDGAKPRPLHYTGSFKGIALKIVQLLGTFLGVSILSILVVARTNPPVGSDTYVFFSFVATVPMLWFMAFLTGKMINYLASLVHLDGQPFGFVIKPFSMIGTLLKVMGLGYIMMVLLTGMIATFFVGNRAVPVFLGLQLLALLVLVVLLTFLIGYKWLVHHLVYFGTPPCNTSDRGIKAISSPMAVASSSGL